MSLRVCFTFWYISLPYPPYPAKQQCQMIKLEGFVDNLNTRHLIFLSLFEVETCPYELFN